MATFNFGDMVYVRATGEIGTFMDAPTIIPGKLVVLLPKVSEKNGIEHGTQVEFYPEELETFEERTRREVGQLVLEQQIRVEAQEQFTKWQELRKKVVEMPEVRVQ